jgi:adenine-specific DNA-methyltransferase
MDRVSVPCGCAVHPGRYPVLAGGGVMTITLLQGDCLPIMRGMEPGSVDLVLVDPPYFEIMGNEWDNQWKSIDDYTAWIDSLAVEWRRLLKPNGSLYVFADDKVAAYVQVTLDKRFLLLNNITWHKTNNLPIKAVFSYRSFAPMTERILFYSAQYDPTGWETVKLDVNNFLPLREYFRQYQESLGLSKAEIVERIGQKADHCFRWNSTQWDLPTPEVYAELEKLPSNHGFLRREYEDLRREYEDLRRVFNADSKTIDIISGPIVTTKDNTEHPTTKPLWIMKRLITVSTNPGALVLDCCAGSGTTGVAAFQTGRNAILIEKDAGYFAIMTKRIHDAEQQMRLPLEES